MKAGVKECIHNKKGKKVEKVIGGEGIIWPECWEKAPHTLSWISKHRAHSGMTSLSLKINNQPLPVQQEKKTKKKNDDSVH